MLHINPDSAICVADASSALFATVTAVTDQITMKAGGVIGDPVSEGSVAAHIQAALGATGEQAR